ncbi:MAG: arginyltransferase [Candidatus Symbiobacter sp.]|nr:arginyltransferase [Candidatus Symbiobacter sp.]
MKFFIDFPRALLHDLRNPLILGPQLCPYLPQRIEYKRVLRLGGRRISAELLDALNQNGFRRTQNTAWKPECGSCRACVSVRIGLAEFAPNASQRRVMRRNRNLTLQFKDNRITAEHYRLFRTYQAKRHQGGEMSEMTMDDLAMMVEVSPVSSQLAEWRDENGRLLAVCLFDRAAHSISLVYSFFDPAAPQRGLGNHMILSLSVWAKAAGLDYLYLGFWVKGSPKMDYKQRFRPLQALTQFGWRDLTPDLPTDLDTDFATDLE